MSTILPDDIGFILRDASQPGSGPASLKTRLGWLREWEQAQWKAGQLRTNTGDHPARGSSGPHEDVPRTPAAPEVHPEPAETRWQDMQMVNASQCPSGDAHTGPGPQCPAAVRVAPHTGMQIVPGLYGANLFFRSASANLGPAPEAVASSLAWNTEAFVEWRPYLLHVMQGAGGVKVWIRDKQLSETRQQEIVASMRRELALRGLSLFSLTVNGREIWRSTDMQGGSATVFTHDSEPAINLIY